MSEWIKDRHAFMNKHIRGARSRTHYPALGLGQPPSQRAYRIGDVGLRPVRRRREEYPCTKQRKPTIINAVAVAGCCECALCRSLALTPKVALLGRALHVVRRLHNGDVQILQGINSCIRKLDAFTVGNWPWRDAEQSGGKMAVERHRGMAAWEPGRRGG